MNLLDVADEVRAAMDTISGLRVPEWGVQRIAAPAGIVLLPERVDYHSAYGRGTDLYKDMDALVLVANPETRQAWEQLSPYVDGTGASSIITAIEGYTYTECDDVTVTWAEFDVVSYAGTPYLAAIFHLDIIGTGTG